MKIKFVLCFLSVVFVQSLTAQSNNKQILFTVEDTPVYASEFIRVYNKNLELVKDESQKDVDEYLKLFINYKLKLQEAKALGLDKKDNYLREFDSYKKQLSKNYLTDTKVTDALVEEAYDRMGYEVDASHILVRLDENATPEDTLKAYNQIVKLRDRVIKEGYKAVQRDVHNGKTIFAEDLGYFSAFKMVYNFENVAFNTKVGEVSKPFRTRFGYHVLTVLDRRVSRGQVTVAHIMIKDDETKINEIYKRIEQGEAFESLAKQFSEDKSSANKGGTLKPFSSGELSSKIFEDVAFNLKEKEVSKPFKSEFGWHVVKLISKKEREPFKQVKGFLENKIKRDSRSKLINDSRISKLKSKYTIEENKSGIAYFKSIINNAYLSGRWSLPTNFEADKPLLKIQDRQLTNNDFAQFLLKSQRQRSTEKNVDNVINTVYKRYFDYELLRYQEDNLEHDNEDYAQILGEYRDGLLLFDLMETEIWNAATTDSIALKEYYNTHKKNYFFKERINGIVASSAKKADIKKVAKLLKSGKTIDEIKKAVNTEEKINVSFTEDEMEANHQALPKKFKFKKGVSKIYKHNDAYIVVKVKEILPKQIKTYDETKGRVISDYQTFKEENWVKELANKYNVTINKNTLKTVKANIKN
ncbi:peptidylprolyl isomerase [Pontimicrobium sp. MEBiC01747]